jgi:protein TonB
MFDQMLVPAPARRPSRWMRVGSLVLHLVMLLLLFVLPITAAIDLPGVYTALPPVMLASVPDIPPAAPPPSAPAPAPSATSIPTEAPPTVLPEAPAPPPSTAFGPPGSLPVSGPGSPVPTMGVINKPTLSVAPPPRAPEPRRVGGDVAAPARITYKAPMYPPTAQAARIEGTVILEAVIDAQGVVQNVRVLRSVPLLDRAAIEAVQQWRYTPTRLNGVAVPIVMTVTVTFSLK